MKKKYYAPATIGNVGAGFDLLGLALRPIDQSIFGDTLSIEESCDDSFCSSGPFKQFLPDDEDNIVLECKIEFENILLVKKKSLKKMTMVLNKNLPLGSGLGSSSSSIVVAIYGLNDFYGSPLNSTELLKLMGKMEGKISGSVHFDNVAPALFGGLCLMDQNELCHQLPIPDHWYWVVAWKDLTIETKVARSVLPRNYDMKTTITFAQNLSLMIHFLYKNNFQGVQSTLKDVIAEPYRKNLLPGFDQVKKQVEAQLGLFVNISGSGPSIFSLAQDLDSALKVQKIFNDIYIKGNGFSKICVVDQKGATLI